MTDQLTAVYVPMTRSLPDVLAEAVRHTPKGTVFGFGSAGRYRTVTLPREAALKTAEKFGDVLVVPPPPPPPPAKPEPKPEPVAAVKPKTKARAKTLTKPKPEPVAETPEVVPVMKPRRELISESGPEVDIPVSKPVEAPDPGATEASTERKKTRRKPRKPQSRSRDKGGENDG
jgi:pyruvate dehydrogenase E2 component (dihydrolipoamide acetyltransferase)